MKKITMDGVDYILTPVEEKEKRFWEKFIIIPLKNMALPFQPGLLQKTKIIKSVF